MNVKDKVKKAWRPLVGVGVTVVLILWSAGVLREKVPPGTVAVDVGMPVAPDAARYRVAVEAFAPRLDVVGTVASSEMVHLGARLGAYVKNVSVSAGQHVKQGDVLLTLDDREIQEQVLAAEAQLQQAESEYKRAQQLFDKQAATDQALTAAEAAFHSAQAHAERARVMRTYAVITAPIDGIVTDRRVEVGDLANPGQVLLSVYDPDRMRLEAPVPVRLVEKLALDQSVTVELDRPGGSFTGRVAQIVSEIDPASRTQLVKVRIESGAARILPGTFGRLWVPDEPRDAILVPGSAIYRVGQLEMVQVVRDGRAIRRAVQTGARLEDRIEVVSGLAAGDEILLQPVQTSTAR
ncbi:MAG: efflux RND transporter periplasmic adaptor subunit [Lentisphaerae bacterium]|nr:efflux RND transporter periplasmic adaptor subunit [Lentisphaerota bacterium]